MNTFDFISPGAEIILKIKLNLLISFIKHFNEHFSALLVIFKLIPIPFEYGNSHWLNLNHLTLEIFELICLLCYKFFAYLFAVFIEFWNAFWDRFFLDDTFFFEPDKSLKLLEFISGHFRWRFLVKQGQIC
jgi:hypothetical protein